MDGFYEKIRDIQEQCLVEDDVARNFSAHFHFQIEIFILRSGKFEVKINNHTRILERDTVVIADSLDLHSYRNLLGKTENCLIIIPFYYLNDYIKLKNQRELESNFIENSELCEDLIRIGHKMRNTSSVFLLKAYVNAILGMILEHDRFIAPNSSKDMDLIRKILTYIEAHFTEPVSLKTIARTFGYSCEHISRTFRVFFNHTIPSYLNMLRLKYVKLLLQEDPQKKIGEAVFEAGFNSLQTYYRVQKKFRHSEEL